MNVIQEISRINEEEFKQGIFGGLGKASWHEKYRNSAWVYLGGFSYELTEGDLICVLSQWGEIEDINLVRDRDTGKSQGFAFIKYEDQRSTILAVDNFNGIKLLGRILRCDHVDKYKLPKEIREKEEEELEANPDTNLTIGPGHAYKGKEFASNHDITQGVNLWDTSSVSAMQNSSSRPVQPPVSSSSPRKHDKEGKSHKKSHKHHKHHKHHDDNNDDDSRKESKHEKKNKKRKSRDKDRQVGIIEVGTDELDARREKRHKGREGDKDEASEARSSSSSSSSGNGGGGGGNRERESREDSRSFEQRSRDNSAIAAAAVPLLPPPFAPACPVASWRGNRDPAARHSTIGTNSSRPYSSNGARESGAISHAHSVSSGTLSGGYSHIGGVNRTR